MRELCEFKQKVTTKACLLKTQHSPACRDANGNHWPTSEIHERYIHVCKTAPTVARICQLPPPKEPQHNNNRFTIQRQYNNLTVVLSLCCRCVVNTTQRQHNDNITISQLNRSAAICSYIHSRHCPLKLHLVIQPKKDIFIDGLLG